MNELAKALFEAHVQHEVARLRGAELPALLVQKIDALYAWLGEVTLDELATREQVLGVIQRCVIDMPISGGVTELAGEMSRVVLSSPSTANTRLDQLLHDDLYEEFAAKTMALDGVRRAVVGLLAQSEAFDAIGARLIARAASGMLSRLLPTGPATRIHQRVAGLESRLTDKLTRLLERLAVRTEREREALLLEALDPEWVRSVADEMWCALAQRPLTEIFASIDAQDLEDFVVLCREFWQSYRQLDFFRRLMTELVGHFFDKYVAQTVQSLITDMGVTEAMIKLELETLLVPLVAQAARDGLLERMVRTHLEPFYASEALRSVLSSA